VENSLDLIGIRFFPLDFSCFLLNIIGFYSIIYV